MKDHIVNEILNLFETKLIVQFGNNTDNANDIDLLIVSNDFNFISRFKSRDLIKRIDEKLDPLCLTTQQFNKLKTQNCSLYESILKTKSIKYGSEATLY
ncbi:MAG: hypothetical protein ACUVQ1_09610 [Candidatus Kapaibacteriales bacterium]